MIKIYLTRTTELPNDAKTLTVVDNNLFNSNGEGVNIESAVDNGSITFYPWHRINKVEVFE